MAGWYAAVCYANSLVKTCTKLRVETLLSYVYYRGISSSKRSCNAETCLTWWFIGGGGLEKSSVTFERREEDAMERKRNAGSSF